MWRAQSVLCRAPRPGTTLPARAVLATRVPDLNPIPPAGRGHPARLGRPPRERLSIPESASDATQIGPFAGSLRMLDERMRGLFSPGIRFRPGSALSEWPKTTGPNLLAAYLAVGALVIKQFGRLFCA